MKNNRGGGLRGRPGTDKIMTETKAHYYTSNKYSIKKEGTGEGRFFLFNSRILSCFNSEHEITNAGSFLYHGDCDKMKEKQRGAEKGSV